MRKRISVIQMNNMTFKRKLRKKLRILFLFSLLLFSFFINVHHGFNKSLGEDNSDHNDLKVAQPWGIIHINDNWSDTTVFPWCSGSGIWSDPYVIQDLMVDGQGGSYCILIENSNDFFQIENCNIYNSGVDPYYGGIILSNVKNGTLINNNCSSNQRMGIYLIDCINITITINEISNNRNGLFVETSFFIDISDNNCTKNSVGLILSQIENSNISKNNISNNALGISLQNFINGSILTNNVTENEEFGLHFNGGCDFNTISGNTISNNKDEGIFMSASYNNTISSNYINYNHKIGVFLIDSGNTSIFTNKLNGCGFGLAGTYVTLISNSIDSNNLVNNKPTYYYINKTGLKQENFTSKGLPGQLILVGCNNSEISNFDITSTSIGFALHYCNNVSISNNTVKNSNNNAIQLWDSTNCKILENSLNNSGYNGIFLIRCSNISIGSNNVSNNEKGIYLNNCFNCSISNNFIFNNSKDQNLFFYAKIGIHLTGSDDNLISGNTITNNSGIGILLRSSNYNNLTKNIVLNNSNGIHLEQSDHNNIINNTSNQNTAKNELLFIGDGGNGIVLDNSNYNNVSINIVMYNRYAGILLADVTNVTVTNNQMIECGLVIQTSTGENPPFYDINGSNIVNNKLLYYYYNEKGLGSSNFTQAGQVLLINCNDSIISNLNVSHCSIGISLWNCSNNVIFNNTVSFDYVGGISLNVESNNNSIFSNNITSCYGYGIGVVLCNNNNVSNCIIEDCNSGILISDCNNTIILNNTLINSYGGGIAIISYYSPMNNTLIRRNSMKGCGILIYAAFIHENSFIIDKSNTVNNKTLYYYYNKIGLTPSNFSNAGQIYLINCNSSLISDVDISNTSIGLAFLDCNNISLSNINVTHNKLYGLLMQNCYNCSISKCVVNNNFFGLIAYNNDNSTISTNDFNNNTFGLQIRDCDYSIIHNNTFSFNKHTSNPSIGYPMEGGTGLHISGCSYNNITDNLIKNNENSGVILQDQSLNNKILRNKIQNNNEFGIHILDSYTSVENTEILYNHFINNGINAEDNGVSNKWDDGYAGNYWDNYIGIDNDPENGIGDNSFSIQGIANAFDANPLLYPIDEDTDGDMLNNYEEYTLGNDLYKTNVTNPDSDYDGVSDYWESENSTNPWEPDTDFDYMPDIWEIDNNLNPLVDDSMDDPDSDYLENLYEYGNETNPQNNDTDGDTFLDGVEVGLGTSPLIFYWYPMPNLDTLEFKAQAAKVDEPFTLNFTIINNGIWRAENVTIRISIQLGNITLWDNFDNPIDELDVNVGYQKLIQITGVNTSGGLLMILELDPLNLINETYSLKNGSKRENAEEDNTLETILDIGGPSGDGIGLDVMWIILIIIGAVAFAGIISSYVILRPRLKRKFIIKRQIKTAKTDIDNFERNIRSFIKANLKDAYESNWWEEGIPEYIRNPVENKIKIMGAKEAKIGIDKMDYIDFLHYHSIITERNNWEQVFSKIFPDKNVVEKNFENLRVFKTNLYEGTIPAGELSNYNIYIHAIRNYFTMGYNIFLSYSTLDADHFKIGEIANKLQSLPRIDKIFFWEADSGENIVTYMERTLRLSKVFVLFCSENSLKSKAVEDEWQVAFQLRKTGKMKIVPVYENEEFIPYLLMPMLNVKYTKDDFDGFIQKLYEEILR